MNFWQFVIEECKVTNSGESKFIVKFKPALAAILLAISLVVSSLVAFAAPAVAGTPAGTLASIPAATPAATPRAASALVTGQSTNPAALNASAATVALNTHQVTLASDQTQFKIAITITQDAPYAGAELALQCASGITMNAAQYSTQTSTAGPVEASGLTWFSYFSGENSYNSAVTVTAQLEYQGQQNTALVLDHVSVFALDGRKVNRVDIPLRETIEVLRQGASNETPELQPPNLPGDNPDNTNNNNSNNNGSNNAGGNNTTGNNTSGSNTSGSNTTGSNGGGAGGNAAGNNGNPYNLVSLPLDNQTADDAQKDDPAVGTSVGDVSPDESANLSTLADVATPLADAGDNTTQSSGTESLTQTMANPILWILLGLCALCLVVLGYVFIKKRRQKDEYDQQAGN
jgi:hypothetical protein